MAKSHRNLRYKWNLDQDPYFARRFHFCQANLAHSFSQFQRCTHDTWLSPYAWQQSIAPGSKDNFLSIATEDTNGDGKPDLTTSYEGNPSGLGIYQAFQDNSYAPIYTVTGSPFVDGSIVSIAIANVNQDPLPEILLAGEESFSVLGLAKDLILTLVSADPNPLTEGIETTLLALVTNNSNQNLSTIDVAFYSGDPSAGGILLGTTSIASLSNGMSISTTLNHQFDTAGNYVIYAWVDPDNLIAEGSEDNNRQSVSLTVMDDDQEPPEINNIHVSEYNGDGDGLLEDNEEVKISWNVSDPAGISATGINSDCTTGPVTSLGGGDYEVLLGPCIIGVNIFSVTATDNDNTPASRTTANHAFEVHYHQPVLSSTNPANGATNIQRITEINAWFETEMTASSLTASSFSLETLAGQPISGTVSYNPSLLQVTFTPNNQLSAQTTYRATIHGGADGVRDENNNAMDSDYSWQFTTIPNQAPAAPFSPVPAESGTDIPLNTDLTWQANDPDYDSLTFTVYFGFSNPPTSILCNHIPTYACNPGQLEEDSTYYWRVVDSDGSLTNQSPVWSFHTHEQVPEMHMSVFDGDTTPDLSDNTDFGSSAVSGGTVSHSFTIHNLGDDNLTLTGNPIVAVSGANPTDFTVSVQPTSPVAPGGSTTFTVIFNPSAADLRTATLSIANNDPDENPYDFAIQGTGTDIVPTVQFSSSSYTVSENGGSATIRITLSAPSDGTVQVFFDLMSGTADTSDYTYTSGYANFFTVGQTYLDISVDIINDSIPEGEEYFTVILSDPINCALGTPSTAQITIVDDESPSYHIYLPLVINE